MQENWRVGESFLNKAKIRLGKFKAIYIIPPPTLKEVVHNNGQINRLTDRKKQNLKS